MEQAYKGEVMCVCGGGIYVNLLKKTKQWYLVWTIILICRSILSTNEDTQGIISLHRFQFEIFIDLL